MLMARLAVALGKGLVAGLAGTAAMTVAQKIAMKVQDRSPSKVPAEAVEKVLHFEPESEQTEQRLANVTHWVYGASWGMARGLLSELRVPRALAGPLHLGLVWGAQAIILPRMGLSKPVAEQPGAQVAEDVTLHGVYATVTDLSWRLLNRHGSRPGA